MSDKMDQLLEGFYSFKKDFENRFDGLEKRFDGLENRFDRLESKVDNLEEQVNENNKIIKDIRRSQITNRRQIAENTLDITEIQEKLKIS